MKQLIILILGIVPNLGCSTQDFTSKTPVISDSNGGSGLRDRTKECEPDCEDGLDGNDGSGMTDNEGFDAADGGDSGKDDDWREEKGELSSGKKTVLHVTKGCSNIGAKNSGTSVLDATEGVSLVFIDYAGNMTTAFGKPAEARQLRDDIIDLAQIEVPAKSAGKDKFAAVALCDARMVSACRNALDSGLSLGGDIGDIRFFPGGLLGYSKGTLVPMNVLYSSAGRNAQSYDCDVKKSPLIIDIDSSGLALSRPTQGVRFDLDNDGTADRISWPTGSNAGFLVLDLNGNGRIDHGGEMFGNATLIGSGKAANGFIALAQYDLNADGFINASDAVFGSLRIWVDGNFNGITDHGELKTLSSLQIHSLNLSYLAVEKNDAYGNSILQESTAELTGSRTVPLVDLWFRVIE